MDPALTSSGCGEDGLIIKNLKTTSRWHRRRTVCIWGSTNCADLQWSNWTATLQSLRHRSYNDRCTQLTQLKQLLGLFPHQKHTDAGFTGTKTLPYLTLPYGKTFYRLALWPLTGPMRIPELTIRLQNPQVQYSPGSIPIPGTIPLLTGGLLTWIYLLICTLGISKRISARKHISTSILVTMTRKTPTQETRVPSLSTPCVSSALLCNPECLLQAHPVCYQHEGTKTWHAI